MYANGDGVPQDLVAAYLWLTLAAAQATEPARASLLQGRAVVAQQLTPGQLAAAEQRAEDWSPVIAETPGERP